MNFKLCKRAGGIKPVSLMRLTQIKDVGEMLKKFDEKDIVAQPKIDGWRLQVVKTDGKVKLFSRRGEGKTDNFSDIVKKLGFLPDNTLVEGELCYIVNGKQSIGEMTSLAGSSPEKSIEKAKELPGKVKLYLFDILWLKGKDISDKSYAERRKTLSSLVKKSESVQVIEEYPFNKWEEVMKKAIKEGGEGVVFKVKTEPYEYKTLGQAEAKPGYMFKLKESGGKSETDDFVVYDAKRTEKGNLKALFGQYYKGKLYHISDISNFSKEDEKEIENKLKKGKFVIEIKYQEKLPGGLRHQSYVKMREDKSPKDATMSKIHIDNLDKFEIVKESFYLSKRQKIIFGD